MGDFLSGILDNAKQAASDAVNSAVTDASAYVSTDISKITVGTQAPATGNLTPSQIAAGVTAQPAITITQRPGGPGVVNSAQPGTLAKPIAIGGGTLALVAVAAFFFLGKK